ncbi:MAG: transcription termination factor NusA [Acidobacteriota bacterium]
MSSLLYQTIEQISREKGIDPEVIIGAVEDAVITATKKYYRTEENLQARLNRETGQVEVYSIKKIVGIVRDPETEVTLREAKRYQKNAELGQDIEIHKPTDVLGRIAAQTAKQVIYQKVREAERDNIFSEYGNRVGQMVTGIVKRAENGDLVVDLGRTEAILPRREQSRAEVFNPGERIRVVIVRVSRTSRGPQVVVSRTEPALLARLFEMEVPEIYEGTVAVKNAVREPGDRAKVAVYSKEKDVDPVGACVGIKGTRVQNVIRELRGEKIDIVEWSEEPCTFAVNALNPAKVSRVAIIDERERIIEVIVEDKQLSLAIGKRGQNVRLAAKLIDWRIDIKSEEEKKREVQSQMEAMSAAQTDIRALSGVGEKTMQKLIDHGLTLVENVAAMTPEMVTEIPGIGTKTAEKIVTLAKAYLEDSGEAMETGSSKVSPLAKGESSPGSWTVDEAAVKSDGAQDLGEALEGHEPGEPERPVGEASQEGSGGER